MRPTAFPTHSLFGMVACVVALSLFFAEEIPAAGAQTIFGTWTDNEDNRYAFLKNNEFSFQAKRHVNPVEGVWEYQQEICWLEPNKRQVGNIIIHIETEECCMNARILGSKLVLSEVWSKGASRLAFDACKNRS